MNRLDKIKQEFLEQFTDKLKEEKVDISVESAFDILISADPSRNKKNVRWLMETYLNDEFLWEDISSGQLSKVHETLNTFIRNKNKLDILDRSINRYQSIADMWKMVKQYAEDKTGKEIKRADHDKAMAESEVVIDNDDMRVVVPLTEYAAKFHGRGTRWCTAADSNNMFLNYAKDSPLFIITLKGSGDKLQLWKNDNNVQFMDADDSNVSINYIEQNWDLLKDIVKYIGLLEYIPKELRTSELCEIAIKIGLSLEDVPSQFKTQDMCKLAVKKSGLALKYVPENILTPELCKLAVETFGLVLQYVPEEMRTYELCTIAVQQKKMVLQYVPENILTPKICKIAVQHNGNALQYVPENLITPELCKIAVEQKGNALQYVPDELLTPELCKLACKEYVEALEHIPEDILTPELYIEVSKRDNLLYHGGILRLIPDEYKTPELCEIALQQYCDNIDYNHSYEFDDERSSMFDGVFEYIPEKYRTPELYAIAIKKDGNLFRYIPEDVFTPELCEEVIKKDIGFIQDIPRKFVTPEFLKFSMEHHPTYAVLYLMPGDLMTYELCEYAIKQGGYYQMQDMGHSTCLSSEEWDSLCKMAKEMEAIQKEEEIRTEKNDTVSEDGIKSIRDKYQNKIDEFKKCFNMPSIEPVQTIHHTM